MLVYNFQTGLRGIILRSDSGRHQRRRRRQISRSDSFVCRVDSSTDNWSTLQPRRQLQGRILTVKNIMIPFINPQW